mgnify:CR=1 FL=1
MPNYVYETVPAEGEEPERFEVRQSFFDPPLEVHPETGAPVRRVITARALLLAASECCPSECDDC